MNPFPINRHFVIDFLHKTVDSLLPFHQHCQCRRLDTPHRQPLIIFCGIRPGCVHPNQPVCFRPAYGGFTKVFIFFSIFQTGKPFPDCTVLHRADPQPFYRNFAARQVIDTLEDQFPFPACVCWIVGIGDLENIHYSRVSNAPMNL